MANNIRAQIPVSPFPGQAFWRSVIDQYCRGNYEDIELDNKVWKGPVQVFDNTARFQE